MLIVRILILTTLCILLIACGGSDGNQASDFAAIDTSKAFR